MNLQPSVSLIGVSGFADVHYNNFLRYHREQRLILQAATVINLEQESEKCRVLEQIGCRIFPDSTQMLDAVSGRCDLCVVSTGIHLHAPMVLESLAAGCNVLVEKPAAPTIQDVLAMREAARAAGRFVAVGFQKLYAPEALAIKRAILCGRIGKVTSIRCRGLWPRGQSYYARNTWAGKRMAGGALVLDSPFNNAFAHEVTMACFLAGAGIDLPAKLTEIEAELYRAREIESPDTACLRIKTAEGIPLTFYLTHSCGVSRDPEILVTGETGEICWGYDSLDLRGSADALPVHILSPQGIRDAMMETLLRRISDPSQFICDLNIAAAQTICANGAHESSEVIQIPREFVTETVSEVSRQPVIREIEEIIGACFDNGLLFSEAGVPWARGGREVSLVNYKEFSAPPLLCPT